jgi:DNA-binding response OmpR family regulator
MDIKMPDMDGPEVLRRIIDEHGEDATHIVAVTASPFEHQRREYLGMGFETLVNKPVEAGELYGALARVLDIEFKTAQPPTKTESDWSTVSIELEVREAISAAAAEFSITDLRSLIDRIEEDGAPADLINQLLEYARDFNFQAITNLMQEISKPEA